jgi:hypothetical protein
MVPHPNPLFTSYCVMRLMWVGVTTGCLTRSKPCLVPKFFLNPFDMLSQHWGCSEPADHARKFVGGIVRDVGCCGEPDIEDRSAKLDIARVLRVNRRVVLRVAREAARIRTSECTDHDVDKVLDSSDVASKSFVDTGTVYGEAPKHRDRKGSGHSECRISAQHGHSRHAGRPRRRSPTSAMQHLVPVLECVHQNESQHHFSVSMSSRENCSKRCLRPSRRAKAKTYPRCASGWRARESK